MFACVQSSLYPFKPLFSNSKPFPVFFGDLIPIIICIYANTADISSINCLSIFPALTLTIKTSKNYKQTKSALIFFLISFATNQLIWPIQTNINEGGWVIDDIDEKGTQISCQIMGDSNTLKSFLNPRQAVIEKSYRYDRCAISSVDSHSVTFVCQDIQFLLVHGLFTRDPIFLFLRIFFIFSEK